MKKELLFSLSKEKGDFRIETFKAGGKGGQHQNKTDSGARVIHDASGCSAESRNDRSQKRNIKIAFKKLVKQPEFKKWLRLETARQTGKAIDVNKQVEESMNEKNIKVEVQENKRWVEKLNAVN